MFEKEIGINKEYVYLGIILGVLTAYSFEPNIEAKYIHYRVESELIEVAPLKLDGFNLRVNLLYDLVPLLNKKYNKARRSHVKSVLNKLVHKSLICYLYGTIHFTGDALWDSYRETLWEYNVESLTHKQYKELIKDIKGGHLL